MPTDLVILSTEYKTPVRAAELSNVDLATAVEAGDTFGGVTLAAGDRVALFGQTTKTENGLWVVKASGAPDRAPDAAVGSSLLGAVIVVADGVFAGTVMVCEGTSPAIVGTDDLTFVGPLARLNKAQVWTVFQRFSSIALTDQSGAGGQGLFFKSTENLTADRQVSVVVNDADRTLTLGGNTTLNGGTHSGTNTGDQTIPTNTYGEASLASNFTPSAANDVYQDTGLSITLPSAGTYLILAMVRGLIAFSSGSTAFLQYKLYNSTLGADVVGTDTVGVVARTINLIHDEETPIHKILTVTGSSVIKLYVFREFAGTVSFNSVATQTTKLTYVKIA